MTQGAPTKRPARPKAQRLSTREKILRVAEKLFAREGFDRVTLRQIARAARQRNIAAVQYHFGSKEALLREIIDRHRQEIDSRREALLAALDAPAAKEDLRSLLRVLVGPLAELLDHPAGRDYLQIQARCLSLDSMRPATRRLVERIARALGAHPPKAGRTRLVVLLLFHALADRAASEVRDPSTSSTREAFVEELIDALGRLYGPPETS